MSPYFETCFSERGRVGRERERERTAGWDREGERDKSLMAREREALGEKKSNQKSSFYQLPIAKNWLTTTRVRLIIQKQLLIALW